MSQKAIARGSKHPNLKYGLNSKIMTEIFQIANGKKQKVGYLGQGRGEREWLLYFGNGNCSTDFQLLGMGTGMAKFISNFWERERE